MRRSSLEKEECAELYDAGLSQLVSEGMHFWPPVEGDPALALAPRTPEELQAACIFPYMPPYQPVPTEPITLPLWRRMGLEQSPLLGYNLSSDTRDQQSKIFALRREIVALRHDEFRTCQWLLHPELPSPTMPHFRMETACDQLNSLDVCDGAVAIDPNDHDNRPIPRVELGWRTAISVADIFVFPSNEDHDDGLAELNRATRDSVVGSDSFDGALYRAVGTAPRATRWNKAYSEYRLAWLTTPTRERWVHASQALQHLSGIPQSLVRDQFALLMFRQFCTWPAENFTSLPDRPWEGGTNAMRDLSHPQRAETPARENTESLGRWWLVVRSEKDEP